MLESLMATEPREAPNLVGNAMLGAPVGNFAQNTTALYDIRDLRPLLAGWKKNRFWPIFARPSPSLKQPVLAR
jgi:hypothetical protein